MGLKGKAAIVTGAAGGIGRQIARRFVDEGARVVLADINAHAVDELSNDLGVVPWASVLAVPTDVTSADDVAQLLRSAHEAHGAMDVLVNCAGSVRVGAADETSDEDWQFNLDVNLRSAYLCSREAFLAMREQSGGSVVNIASAAGLVGRGRRAAYSAAKGGMLVSASPTM